ncbi:hypothetical protein GGF42_001511 [Coemansia sp. RSA 2424]|nr:hypothetical protein GGF42_001511 [Coemansia sp. RSA 2424]
MDLNTRLDQSLDQIIKENRNQRQVRPKPQAKAQAQPQAKTKTRSRAKVAVAKHVSDISSRLSTSGAAKPARRTKNTAKAVVPAASARTGISARLGAAGGGGSGSKPVGSGKTVAGRVGKAAKPESGGRLAGLAEKKRIEEQQKAKPAVKPNVKISIRGEAGPATVFISNLDSEASPEDVMTCFKQFGAIKNCTLLYDRTGKASGHAEVTYASKQAAEEAAGKLNNALADGRRLSVQLVRGSSKSPAQLQAHQPQPSAQAHGQQPQSSRGPSSSHRGGPWRKPRRAGGSQMDID